MLCVCLLLRERECVRVRERATCVSVKTPARFVSVIEKVKGPASVVTHTGKEEEVGVRQ